MFNKNLIDVLSQVNGITNSVILKYPQTVAVSEAGDILLLIDVSKLDSDSFPDLGLKDSLSDFLSLFKLFPEDSKIEIVNNTVNITAEASSSSYITDNIALMDAYNRDPEQFDKTEAAPSVAKFELTGDDIKKIKQATGVFKDLSEVIIKSQDGDITVSLGATNKFNAKSHSYSVTKNAETSKEFDIKLPVENFKVLPVSTYEVQVKYNPTKDAYRILLINNSLEGFKIMLSVKA